MEDKAMMENLLLSTKGVCDLYMHGAIESGTVNVSSTFKKALQETLCMQDDLYQKMSAKGWYATQQADAQQITQVKNKFAGQM